MPGKRKGKFDAETRKRILDLIRAGVPNDEASQAVGIHKTTFYRHQAEDATFATDVQKAFAECVAGKVIRVRKAEDESWQAAAWWLERRVRKDFGRVDRHEHTGKDEEPIRHEHTIDLKALSLDQLRDLKQILDAASRPGDTRPTSRNGARGKEPLRVREESLGPG